MEAEGSQPAQEGTQGDAQTEKAKLLPGPVLLRPWGTPFPIQVPRPGWNTGKAWGESTEGHCSFIHPVPNI